MGEQSVTSPRERMQQLKAKQPQQSASEPQGVPAGNEGLAARMAAVMAGKPDPAAIYPGERDDEPPREDYDDSSDDDQAEHRPAGEDEGELQGQDEGELQGQDEGEGKPGTVDDAAKQLGLTRQEFNALQVQVGDQSLTLGELKAKLPELARLDRDRESLEDERGTWELERVATYRNINAIIDQLPRNALTGNLLRELQEHHEQTRERELQNLHFARPKWANPEFATAARAKMVATAKEYGFGRVEIEGVMDHRHLLMLQDFADLKEKFKASRDNARKLSEPTQQRKGAPSAVQQRGESINRPRAKPTFEQRAKQAAGVLFKR